MIYVELSQNSIGKLRLLNSYWKVSVVRTPVIFAVWMNLLTFKLNITPTVINECWNCKKNWQSKYSRSKYFLRIETHSEIILLIFYFLIEIWKYWLMTLSLKIRLKWLLHAARENIGRYPECWVKKLIYRLITLLKYLYLKFPTSASVFVFDTFN